MQPTAKAIEPVMLSAPNFHAFLPDHGPDSFESPFESPSYCFSTVLDGVSETVDEIFIELATYRDLNVFEHSSLIFEGKLEGKMFILQQRARGALIWRQLTSEN